MSGKGDYELGPDPGDDPIDPIDPTDSIDPVDPVEPEEPELLLDQDEGEGPPIILIAGIALVAIVLLVAAFFVLRGCGRPEPEAPPAPAPIATPSPVPATPEPTPEPIELPPLDESDELIRQLAAALSSHPEFATWLAQPHLVRTLVVVVDNVADGASPARALRFWKPDALFMAEEVGGGGRMDPAGYARYDVIGAIAASTDAEGVAQLYRQIEPLADAAYVELGYQDRDFADTLRRAIEMVLTAPIVLERPALQRRVLAWRFVDPELEALPEAQKHLVRMGPENTRRIQAKLREIAVALGLAAGP